jgi:hypothetical protein
MRIPRPKHIKFSNLALLTATRNTHALMSKQATEHLTQNTQSPNFKSIQYRVNKNYWETSKNSKIAYLLPWSSASRCTKQSSICQAMPPKDFQSMAI